MNHKYRIILLLATIISTLLLIRTVGQDNAPKQAQPPANTLYDSDPNHLWNRLYAAFFIRAGLDGVQYGTDSLDPYLWDDTTFLLEGDSHKRALAVLDEFLDRHGENLIRDPVKRAFLQHDLWAVFDWAGRIRAGAGATAGSDYRPQAADLTARLSKAIRRLALTEDQIRALPDNYAAAVVSKKFPGTFNPDAPDISFLPGDLWHANGPWICLERDNGFLPAPRHTQEFRAGNAFLVFVNLPNGRQATLDYLSKISHFPRFIPVTTGTALPQSIQLNPVIPGFPKGTAFALVRRMLLINDKGDVVTSPITMSVQLRVYRSVDLRDNFETRQAFYEFKLQRRKLFASDSGGFHGVGRDEKEPLGFLHIYSDLFQATAWVGGAPKALNCMDCHGNSGIQSALSITQGMNPPVSVKPPVFTDTEPASIYSQSINWKDDQFTWGLLRGLWQNEK